MIDSLERMRAGNPVRDIPAPAIDALRARIEEDEHATPRRDAPRRAGLRWRHRLTAMAALAVLLAVLLVMSGGSRHEPSILAKAFAATDSSGMILHYRERLTLTLAGRTHLVRSAEVWMSGSRARSLGRNAAGQLSENVLSAHRERIYDASRNRITELRFKHAYSMRSAYNIPNWMSNPISQLRSWYAHGRLRLARRETRDSRRYDLLVSSGRPSGTRAGTRVLIEAHAFTPVEISNRIAKRGGPTARWTVRFSAFQRLPLTPARRAELRMAPHPGAARARLSGSYAAG